VRVTVVGSADAFNSLGRAHSCYLVEGEGCGPAMIDFGATALSALRRARREPTEIEAFIITHLHGDHIGGFPFLLIDGMFNEVRTRRMHVVGPLGTKSQLDAQLRVAYGVVADFRRPYELDIEELAPGESTNAAGFEVRAFAAAHMDPPDAPLCLRLVGPDGRSVAFSGDTEMCEGLFSAADGADLLIAECTGMRPPAGRHCTWDQWHEQLPRIRAKRVLLSHLGKDVRERVPVLLEEMRMGPRLAFADDGQIIPV
jgi:ribonuclease BN (tRNA processing enzyme)